MCLKKLQPEWCTTNPVRVSQGLKCRNDEASHLSISGWSQASPLILRASVKWTTRIKARAAEEVSLSGWLSTYEIWLSSSSRGRKQAAPLLSKGHHSRLPVCGGTRTTLNDKGTHFTVNVLGSSLSYDLYLMLFGICSASAHPTQKKKKHTYA